MIAEPAGDTERDHPTIRPEFHARRSMLATDAGREVLVNTDTTPR
jgi:hypothetical protein